MFVYMFSAFLVSFTDEKNVNAMQFEIEGKSYRVKAKVMT